MAFTIPNEDDAGDANQAEVDSVDIDILIEALRGHAVLRGCAVTAQGTPDQTVAVAAGDILVNGSVVAVAAGNVSLSAADGSNPRFDLITVNSSGTKAATNGTAAAEPDFPAIPANSIVLAAVYRPTSDNTIEADKIIDKRIIIPAIWQDQTADGNSNYPTHLLEPMGFRQDPDVSTIIELAVAHKTPTASSLVRCFRTNALWDGGAGVNNILVEAQDIGSTIQARDGTSGHQYRAIVAEGGIATGSPFSSGHTMTVAEMEYIRITMQLSNARTGTTVTYTDAWGLRIRYNQIAQGTVNCTRIKGMELWSPFAGSITDYTGIHIFDVSQPSGNIYLLEIGTLEGTSGTATTSAPTYFRVVGNFTAAANATPLYISEGATPTLRQLKTKDGAAITGGDLVCVLV